MSTHTRPSERRLRRRTHHRNRVFDVQPSRDDESLNYPVRPVLTSLGADDVTPFAKAWRRGTVLDQGSEGACVGHAVTQELISSPERVVLAEANLRTTAPVPPTDPQEFAFWLYHRAQHLDQWPGEDYDGTSANAGMKVARNLGLIGSWRWAETYRDVRDTLMLAGPVVVTLPWTYDMYEAPGGVLPLPEVGSTAVGDEVAGWHAILMNAYDPRCRCGTDTEPGEKIRLTNSWGTEWGDFGSAWADARRFYAYVSEAGGEFVVPLDRTVARSS